MAGFEHAHNRAIIEIDEYHAAQDRLAEFCELRPEAPLSPSELAISLRGVSRAISTIAYQEGRNTFPLSAPMDDNAMGLQLRAYLYRTVAGRPVDSGLLGKRIKIESERTASHSDGATIKIEIEKPDLLGVTKWEDLSSVVLPTDRLIIDELEDPAQLNERESIVAIEGSKTVLPFHTKDVYCYTPARYFKIAQSLSRELLAQVCEPGTELVLADMPYSHRG